MISIKKQCMQTYDISPNIDIPVLLLQYFISKYYLLQHKNK